MKNTYSKKHVDVYDIVTSRIIELLEKGEIPWRKSWAESGLPKNLITKRHYNGINVWLLNSLNYSQNYFLTFKQVKELGGAVKKGEKSMEVIFYKQLEIENKHTNEIEKVPVLRYYNVFNIDQCEGIPKDKLPPVITKENNSIESCEQIVSGMPNRPRIIHNEQRAFYNRALDFINVPKMKLFDNSKSYYSTLFHELVHSTGHSERLNRKELLESRGMKTEDYATEELTAEMGASYLKSHSGIPITELENNTAYIQAWLKRLKEDKKFIVHAAAKAQQAVDFILGIRNEEKKIEEQKRIDERERELSEERGKEKIIGRER